MEGVSKGTLYISQVVGYSSLGSTSQNIFEERYENIACHVNAQYLVATVTNVFDFKVLLPKQTTAEIMRTLLQNVSSKMEYVLKRREFASGSTTP